MNAEEATQLLELLERIAEALEKIAKEGIGVRVAR